MTPQHIAILDDEADITQLLATYLGANGYRTTELHSGAALMALMASAPADLVLLDLGLPGEDGFAIARRLRERWRCGLVIVTGRGDAVDKVVGLEIGADDYVTKPFDLRELLARVKAVLRRTHGDGAATGALAAPPPAPPPPPAFPPPPPPSPAPFPADRASSVAFEHQAGTKPIERFRFCDWLLDRRARRLSGADGQDVALTSGEFELLNVFVEHAGRVLTRDFLLESTRGRDAAPFDRTIDVLVGRLRKKLETDPQDPQILKSVRGVGYVLVAPVRGVGGPAAPQ